MSAALAAIERGRLAELEQVVERGLQTFYEVGAALLEIRDGRLYRETHASFEAYCGERWQLSRPAAYRAIDAARVVDVLSPIGDVPANEAQARELVPLLREDEEAVVEVWRELRAEYGTKDVTAKKVGNLVRRRLERKRREETRATERAELEARFVDHLGRELVSEEYVTYSTPRVELGNEYLRFVEGLERLRTEIADQMFSQACEAFCSDWMPYLALLAACRGKRAATPDRRPAEELLPPVDRYLFEQPAVVAMVRALDSVIDAEREAFVNDFREWLSQRMEQVGESIDSLRDDFLDLVDAQPETKMEAGRGFALRPKK